MLLGARSRGPVPALWIEYSTQYRPNNLPGTTLAPTTHSLAFTESPHNPLASHSLQITISFYLFPETARTTRQCLHPKRASKLPHPHITTGAMVCGALRALFSRLDTYLTERRTRRAAKREEPRDSTSREQQWPEFISRRSSRTSPLFTVGIKNLVLCAVA